MYELFPVVLLSLVVARVYCVEETGELVAREVYVNRSADGDTVLLCESELKRCVAGASALILPHGDIDCVNDTDIEPGKLAHSSNKIWPPECSVRLCQLLHALNCSY